MSYDIDLLDPATGEPAAMPFVHEGGGTYPVGGTDRASFNITYNYARHFVRVLGGKGIRTIYGLTGEESIPLLTAAIETLGDDIDPDYWQPTEGNARRALMHLLGMARVFPSGVWDGD